MIHDLKGMRVAILVEDDFEQVEMTEPRDALKKAGAETALVSSHGPKLQGWKHKERGDTFTCDLPLAMTSPDSFDALMLPGGVMNADALRLNHDAIEFVRAFAEERKPIAAICHAPWVLIEAFYVKGKKITSWPSLQTDLRNAGADWVNATVAEAPGLVTSRKPDDIPEFCEAMIRLFAGAVMAHKA